MQRDEGLPPPPQAWFFVLDAGRARLLTCRRAAFERLRVEELSALAYEPEPHQRGRPSPRTGKSGKTYASLGREDEHQIRRFAKEVEDWIEAHVERIDAPRIALFAAPRFLGELRKLLTPSLAKRLEERPADLTHLSTSDLAKHPSVAELLPA
jgi:protein required for attachment to host cells